MIPFRIKLENGTEQVLNLATVQRISFVPETDDESHPRLADDPPPGILAVLLFSPEFTVTLRQADAERLFAVTLAIEAKLEGDAANASLYRLLSPPDSKQEGDAK